MNVINSIPEKDNKVICDVINSSGAGMEITIEIDPEKLTNPDSDLRYTIADEASRLSSNMIEDDGYDYDDKDNMLIFLSSKLPHNESQNIIMQVLGSFGVEKEATKLSYKSV